jgi:glucokinase
MRGTYIIGIDLGGTNLKIALLSTRYNILYKRVLSTTTFTTKRLLVNAIARAIGDCMRRYNLRKKDIAGVGLGVPGPVDTRAGVVHFFPNIPGWHDVGLKKILAQRTGLSIYLDNDANCMCLAEYTVGAAHGTANAVCITLGTGVGGGIIIEGKLYRGSTYVAGEIGHIPLNEQGPRCNCGGIACLERYVGNNQILQEVQRVFGRRMSLEYASNLAAKGNARARAIWRNAGAHLGVAIAGAVNLLNPDIVVIGGGLANAGSVLFDEIRRVLRSRAMSVQASHVRICKAALGSEAGLVGAAILVRKKGHRRFLDDYKKIPQK